MPARYDFAMISMLPLDVAIALMPLICLHSVIADILSDTPPCCFAYG